MARPGRPASAAASTSPALPLCAGLLAGGPTLAAVDNDALLAELRRLAERVEQLETANRRLAAALAALAAPAVRETEKVLGTRLHDVELGGLSMRKQARMTETVEGMSAGAALTMVAQRANADADATASGEDESDLNNRADISVTLPGGAIGDAEGRTFAHIRVGQDNGLKGLWPTLTGTPNATAFRLTHGDDAAALLAQARHQPDVPLDGDREEASSHVEINFGKIDPFVFFDRNAVADDESTRFLNNVFVHNPLLDSGGDVGVDEYGFTSGARIAVHNLRFLALGRVMSFHGNGDRRRLVAAVGASRRKCWPAPEVIANVNRDELGDPGLKKQEMDDIVALLGTLTDGPRPEVTAAR